MSKKITKQELKEQFVQAAKDIAYHWAAVEDRTDKQRCDGVAYSILALIDGCVHMPSMDLVMRPNPKAKEHLIGKDEDWVEEGMIINRDAYLHSDSRKKE